MQYILSGLVIAQYWTNFELQCGRGDNIYRQLPYKKTVFQQFPWAVREDKTYHLGFYLTLLDRFLPRPFLDIFFPLPNPWPWFLLQSWSSLQFSPLPRIGAGYGGLGPRILNRGAVDSVAWVTESDTGFGVTQSWPRRANVGSTLPVKSTHSTSLYRFQASISEEMLSGDSCSSERSVRLRFLEMERAGTSLWEEMEGVGMESGGGQILFSLSFFSVTAHQSRRLCSRITQIHIAMLKQVGS